jgi:DNA-binding GntR family transcriptional regulator
MQSCKATTELGHTRNPSEKGIMLIKSFQMQVPTSALADEVADAIFNAILAGEFTCGQCLTAAEVAEWLGVSRTPVREAFVILHRRRLLDKDTSRSFVVAQWNKQDLLELAQLRAALEALVVELAIPKISIREIDILKSIVMQMESAFAHTDYDRLVTLDSQFHYTLWQIPGNTRLLQTLEDLKTQIRYFMHITRPGDEIDYVAMHRNLIEVLQSGDVERAKAEIAEHILSTARRMIARVDDS